MFVIDKKMAKRWGFSSGLSFIFIIFLLSADRAPALGETDADIDSLLQELKDEDVGVRQSAALALEQRLGVESGAIRRDDHLEQVVKALIDTLADVDPGVRQSAAAAMRAIGPKAKPAERALAKLLEDEHASVRIIAVEALGNIGAGALKTAPALIERLDDDDSGVRVAAVVALGKMGQGVVPLLAAAIQDQESAVNIRRNAIGALSHARNKSSANLRPAAQSIGSALGDDDGMVRGFAVLVLEDNRSLAREIVPQLIASLASLDVAPYAAKALRENASVAASFLIEALEDQNVVVRRYSAKILSDSRSVEPAATPALIRALEDSDVSTRSFAALALGQTKAAAADTVPALIWAIENDPAAVVRRNSARGLMGIGEAAQPAIPALIRALQTDDVFLQRYAAEALGAIGRGARGAETALKSAVKHPNRAVRRAAATSLTQIGSDPEDVVPILIEVLRAEEDSGLRTVAAESLGKMKDKASGSTAALVAALQDRDWGVRTAAAASLGQIGASANDAIPYLVKSLSDQPKSNSNRQDPEAIEAAERSLAAFRSVAFQSLVQIGGDAVPVLAKLTDPSRQPDAKLRREAISTLARVVPQQSNAIAEDVVQALSAALSDEDQGVRETSLSVLSRLKDRAVTAMPALLAQLGTADGNFRRRVIDFLAQLGFEGRKAIPALTGILAIGDRGERSTASNALGRIAEDIYLNAPVDRKLSDIDTTLADLRAAQTELKKFDDLKNSPSAKKVNRAIGWLQDEFWSRLQDHAVAFVEAYPVIAFGVPLYLAWVLFWVLALWLAPRSILGVNKLLRPLEIELPGRLGRVKLPLRYLLFVGFLNYSPRVLDAWVAANIGSVRERFAKKRTVEDREVHIPVPVALDRKTVSDLTRDHTRPIFDRGLGCLLIWGEGGSGKTSLACQIARWAMAEDAQKRICDHIMLPVLIEQELNVNVPEGRDPLTEAIAKQVQDLTDQEAPISDDLLRELLRQRRILVIVDHLSEMGEATRANIAPELSGFPVNAMIVTSRLEEELGGITKTVIRPLRITGNRLSSFMEAYLTERGKREDFADSEFFDACRRLSAMVGDRDITLLLAKLYAEQMISAKSSEDQSDLPATIPDLMLSYLNELNLGVSEDKVEDRHVHHTAKVLAWECVKQTFRPTPARYEDVIAALEVEDAQARIDYLETRLRLCRSVQPAQEQVSILLDPLAEYLAGLHLVDTYGDREAAWRDFFTEADSKFGAPWAIRGFLLAVRDCVLARSAAIEIPAFVEPELRKRAVVSPSSTTPLASAA